MGHIKMSRNIKVVTTIGIIFLMQKNACICVEEGGFNKGMLTDDTRCDTPCPGLNTTNCGSKLYGYADLYRHLKTGIIFVLNNEVNTNMIYVKIRQQTIVNNTTNLILVVLNKGETNVTLSEQSQK